ncbi:lysylphosphatidylglycerol synthase transmembrane domain-containing protein [Mesorhizobium sp. M7A.F.Ca.MR.245.00.0.0]|uniref:lysylphosphatidylglycerol synthase transmembrane domain-containing protein n=1 Tax=Mesorhizobium sp. M7A.F.Ca.MR.245.00.0.0 TaxID=2496778 RepID=UPI000FCAF0DC|nr:lysylphosphatidylglycerol synthase transmembrane domain-containing protein [Mesorhizobium sp. M7A.F.Ca.MR.245.00.0.0]RUV15679.1 flippase-like domain-containing protein [Mesorhizobium sp. M7A.F.Ca.MR.245.00.0.0]
MTRAATLSALGMTARTRWPSADIAMVAARVALSGTLLAAAMWLSSDEFAWRDLAAIGPGSIATCLLLSGVIVFTLAWRWRYIVATTTEAPTVPSMADFSAFTWVGLAVNQLVPSVVGGDAVRITLLARWGIPASAAAGSVIVDRFYGVLGLLVVCLAAAPMLSTALFYPAMITSIVIVIAVIASGLLAWWTSRRLSIFQRLSTMVLTGISWRSLLIMVPVAMAGHLANIAMFLVIAHALGAQAPILPTISVLAAVLLASVLPFSIAGWGLREFALVNAFTHLGLDHDKIVLSSVAYGLFVLVTQAAGFLMILRRKRT